MKKLLERAQRLLDKGNVRYSDGNFEEERIKLFQDITDFLKTETQLSTEEADHEPKRVHLPVLK